MMVEDGLRPARKQRKSNGTGDNSPPAKTSDFQNLRKPEIARTHSIRKVGKSWYLRRQNDGKWWYFARRVLLIIAKVFRARIEALIILTIKLALSTLSTRLRARGCQDKVDFAASAAQKKKGAYLPCAESEAIRVAWSANLAACLTWRAAIKG